MLRLDSSDMLPDIQKGEETARSLKTQPLWLSQLVMITWTGNETGNDHVTRADELHIWFSDGHLHTKTVDGIPVLIILP